MGDNTLSEILGLFIPSGFCISDEGGIIWSNDNDDVLNLRDKAPENIAELFTDKKQFEEVLKKIQSLNNKEQYVFSNVLMLNGRACYANVKHLGAVANIDNAYALNIFTLEEEIISKLPHNLMRTLSSVNLDYFIKNLGIPFSLFSVIRDENEKPVDLRFISINKAYAEMAKRDIKDISGKTYSEIYQVIDEDFVSLLGGISRERGINKFIDFEKGLQNYIEISASSPIDNVVGCVYNDISDLVLANKSLQQEEEYIRTLIEVNPDIIFVLSKDGIFQDCHSTADNKLFFKEEEFLGKHISDILEPELACLTSNHIDTVLKHRRLEEFQYDFSYTNGIRYYEARMVPHNNDQVVCIVRDISSMKNNQLELEQKRNEVQENNNFLMEVMEGVGYPLWVIDVTKEKKLILKEINTNYQEVFGLESMDMRGMDIEEKRKFYDKEYVDNVVSHYYNCVKSKKAEVHERVLIKQDTGEKMYLLVNLMPKLDQKGNVYRIIGSATDISGLKKTQDDLIHAKEKAMEADKLKSAFLANMSHEIRTPLNSITGFSELIQDEDLTPDERQDMCRIIEKNSSQLLKLVNDIIEISKIESEQIKLIFRKFDLNHLMNDLMQEMELDMYRKKKVLPIKVNKGVKEGLLFGSDEFRIKQIFQHLLDNALKFTTEGEIEFGYIVDDQSRDVEFYVKDTGIGIPADKQGSIFELFRQLDESSTRKYGGTGLGLSICKKLVGALDGSIWVDSKDGEGAIFRFKLKNSQGHID